MAIRVLLADDVPDIRGMFRLVVNRDERFKVVGEAGDGEEAVRMAQDLRPDLVLLDIAMPKMDGLEAIPKIREHLNDGRIVVISGFAADTLAETAITICADAYVEKGQPLQKLTDFLARVVDAPPKALAYAS